MKERRARRGVEGMLCIHHHHGDSGKLAALVRCGGEPSFLMAAFDCKEFYLNGSEWEIWKVIDNGIATQDREYSMTSCKESQEVSLLLIATKPTLLFIQ